MGRIIGENIKNKLIIKDQFSGDPLTLYYRPPTTAERIAYKSAMWKREGNKVISRVTEARQEYGALIIEGFEEGDFRHKVGDELKIFSSNSESPNYFPAWKGLLKQYASDVLEALAEHAFEGVLAIPSQDGYSEKN